MGFDGRGRHYRWQKRDLVGDYLRLTAHRLIKPHAEQHYVGSWQWLSDGRQVASLVCVIRPGPRAVELRYSYRGTPIEPYLVHWESTTPRYGGQRYWWHCPRCGRRCAHLYGGHPFLCRQCHGLTYASAQSGDPRSERIDRRMWAIRRRLGDAGGALIDPLPTKPPYMRWSTYDRLCWEYRDLELLSWGELALMLGLDAERPEMADMLENAWADLQHPPARAALTDEEIAQIIAEMKTRRAPPARRAPQRHTLGELARIAQVPLTFARAAQAEGLLRPDAGRSTRRKRYRPKAASWLAKLQRLQQAGYDWPALRAWAARRFTPGHETERRWPAGYDPDQPARPACYDPDLHPAGATYEVADHP